MARESRRGGLFFLLCFVFTLSACSGGGGTPPVTLPPVTPPPVTHLRNVTLSWLANHESAVNRSGGGYRVYYSSTPGFALASVQPIDVPWTSGAHAPTTTTASLLSGSNYYVKVVAYSSLNTAGSAPSSEYSFFVPN
jgi:hypothetical protein